MLNTVFFFITEVSSICFKLQACEAKKKSDEETILCDNKQK